MRPRALRAGDRLHRPVSRPPQMPAVVEAALLELRRWGPTLLTVRVGLVFELGKGAIGPLPSLLALVS